MIKFELERWRDYLLLFVTTFFFLIFLLPVYPGMPAAGLDPSWSNTINYALTNNFKFGTEIVFTYGPLGSLRFPGYVYAEPTYYPAVIISIIFSTIVAYALFLISKPESTLTILIGIGAVFIGLLGDGLMFWYLIPLIFIMLLMREENKRGLIVSLFIVVILAFSILVKFSHLPIVFISVLLADIYFIYKRKLPIFTFSLFAFWLVIYSLSGQALTDFWSYFWGSFATLSGYSESMNIFGPAKMIYAFLVLFSAMFLLLVFHFYKNLNIKLFLVSFLASVVLFMAFKQGFVRHDGHAISAFSGMAIVFGMLFLTYSKLLSSKLSYGLATGFVILAAASLFEVRAYYSNSSAFKLAYNTAINFKNRVVNAPAVFSRDRLELLNIRYEQANKKIIEIVDLSSIVGTVDIYPWDQSYVIAHGLQFSPRPLFQSYSVYTDELIRNNIEFIKSERATENILFRFQEIDGRLPSTMEGASWLEILSRYDAIDVIGNFLHLKKADNPRTFELTNKQHMQGVFEKDIPIPYNNAFVKINMPKNAFGKVANTLFKTPVIKIQLNFSDGTTQTSRIIPAMARNGFILTPYLSNIIDFYKFGVGELAGKKVVSFRLINTADCCYKDLIDIEFSKIDLENASKGSYASTAVNKLDFIYDIQSKANHPHVNVSSYQGKQVLFSHVGRTIEVSFDSLSKIASNSALTIHYGFYDSAYSGDNRSDGGCFKVYQNQKTPENLVHNVCLDPRGNPADRGEHQFLLQLQESVENYVFEVTPREGFNSSWGWSYWRF